MAALTLAACSPGSPAGSDAAGEAPADSSQQATAEDAPGGDTEGREELGDPAAVLPPTEQFPTRRVVLTDDDTRVALAVHVAADPEARRQGLMGRDSLPRRAGMLFLFPGDTRGGFWMKDTTIPLSIAFFGPDGGVRSVLDMAPCRVAPCPRYTPGVAYHGALEVNQGAFADFGLTGTDWRVRLPENLPEPR